MALDLEQAKEHVESSKSNTNTAGLTTIRHDASVIQRAKEEVGVSQNTEVAPLLDAIISDYFGLDDVAEEKMEEFRNQFEEEE